MHLILVIVLPPFAVIMRQAAGEYAFSAAQGPDKQQQNRCCHQQRRAGEHSCQQQHRGQYQQQIADAAVKNAAQPIFEITHKVIDSTTALPVLLSAYAPPLLPVLVFAGKVR